MGYSTIHALARDRHFYVTAETVLGTLVQPTGTEAVKVLAANMGGGAKPERLDRMDNHASRDVLARITGNINPIEWSVEKYLIPSGAAGTPPDDHLLWKSAFGTYANSVSTSDTYSTNSTQGSQGSFGLYDNIGYVTGEHLKGCIVQEVKISGSGGEPPKVSFSGVGKTSILTGRSALAGAFSTSTVTVGDGSFFQAGSLVAIIDPTTLAVVDSNSGAGFPVASVTGQSVVVTGSPAGTDAADILVPWAPAETTAGTPTSGKDMALTIGGTAVRVTQYEISLNNQHNIHADEAGNQTFSDYDEGMRMITGKFTFRARADWAVFMAERTELAMTHAIVLTLGSGAGNILTVTMSYCEYDFAQIGKPENGTCMFELPFRAFGSTGNDAITAVFT